MLLGTATTQDATRKLVLPTALMAGMLCMAASSWAAPVQANFTDGTGTTLPDQFKGTAGDGWAGPWVTSTADGAFKSGYPRIENTTPLNGGGNYLVVQADTVGVDAAISRQWSDSAVSYSSPSINISFDYRFDSIGDLNNTADVFSIFEGSSAVDSSFGIYFYGANTGGAQAAKWAFYNGTQDDAAFTTSRLSNTNVAVVAGAVYTFAITLNPADRTWTASISQNGSLVYTSGTLGFNTSSTSVDGILNFATRGSFSTDDPKFSIDNISVVPEPTALAAVALTGMALLGRRRGA